MNNIDFTKMPIVDAVNELIIVGVESRASDIHFDPCDQGLKVRNRIDGVLETYTVLPTSIRQNVVTRIKLLSGMNITETRLPQDGAIKTVLKNHNLDLRVSSLPTKKGEKIVIRILDYTMSIKGIEYLYFNETNYKKILKMIGVPYGIILVTGATGSGKSTTVYSFLQRLNVEGVNLITVEDPVEMDIEGINQVQVNSDIGLDFAAVLRSILRQDPNVIMIGEIRDSETARIAVRASITGHLVLSTIHTNNSLNTIERLLDMDVERYLLASALEGIISQTLARKLCDKCKVLRPTTTYEKQLFKAILNKDVPQIYTAGDCPECSSGFHGRIALQEVLLINQEIRDAISEGLNKEELRELVYNGHVITMLQDGLYKVLAGFTTMEEVLKLVDIDDSFLEIKASETNNLNTKYVTMNTPNSPTNNNIQAQNMNMNAMNMNTMNNINPMNTMNMNAMNMNAMNMNNMNTMNTMNNINPMNTMNMNAMNMNNINTMSTMNNINPMNTMNMNAINALSPVNNMNPVNSMNNATNTNTTNSANSINEGIAKIKESIANNNLKNSTNENKQNNTDSTSNENEAAINPIQNLDNQNQNNNNTTNNQQQSNITSNQNNKNNEPITNSTIANGFDMQNNFVTMNMTNN